MNFYHYMMDIEFNGDFTAEDGTYYNILEGLAYCDNDYDDGLKLISYTVKVSNEDGDVIFDGELTQGPLFDAIRKHYGEGWLAEKCHDEMNNHY
jgi:hypothetical protein